jgi:hypothetical protein
MAVSFERYGRLYYLDPGGHEPKIGDKVLVPTDGGPEAMAQRARMTSPGTKTTGGGGPRDGSPRAG